MYPQPSLNATQSTLAGIPLTMVGPNSVEGVMPMAHPEGLSNSATGTLDASMMMPHSVRLPGGETVAWVTPIMMEHGHPHPVAYPPMVPVNLDKSAAVPSSLAAGGMQETYPWRTTAGVPPTPLQRTNTLSRTPSLNDSEETGDTKQTRIGRFQVRRGVEEAVRRSKLLSCSFVTVVQYCCYYRFTHELYSIGYTAHCYLFGKIKKAW